MTKKIDCHRCGINKIVIHTVSPRVQSSRAMHKLHVNWWKKGTNTYTQSSKLGFIFPACSAPASPKFTVAFFLSASKRSTYLWIVNHNYKLSPCILLFDRLGCQLFEFFFPFAFRTTIIGLYEGQFNVFISRASWYSFHLRLNFFLPFSRSLSFSFGFFCWIQTCNSNK